MRYMGLCLTVQNVVIKSNFVRFKVHGLSTRSILKELEGFTDHNSARTTAQLGTQGPVVFTVTTSITGRVICVVGDLIDCRALSITNVT